MWRRVAKTARPLDTRRQADLDALEQALGAHKATAEPRRGSLRSGAASGALSKPKAAAGPNGGREHSALKRAGLKPADRGAEKKVRRGRLEVEAKLDLHGLTAAKARRELLNFVVRCSNRGLRQVLVVTGKGAGARALDARRFSPWSPDERAAPGVLRRALPVWLNEPDFAPLVSGFATAHARHGGTGAYYLMLRG